jgi:hypothetical protein
MVLSVELIVKRMDSHLGDVDRFSSLVSLLALIVHESEAV